jgi:hypothetical protein
MPLIFLKLFPYNRTLHFASFSSSVDFLISIMADLYSLAPLKFHMSISMDDPNIIIDIGSRYLKVGKNTNAEPECIIPLFQVLKLG